MPELNFQQITDKLNQEFAGEGRKIVFWYDDQGEFTQDIDALELVGAKIFHLAPDNQFYTKYLLERLDKDSNYLLYAPFSKPPVEQNHLEDTLLYSKRFSADRSSLLAMDLKISEKYRPVIQKYIAFFAAKDRTQKFYDLEMENFNKETIEVAIMCVLCKTRNVSFDEVLRVVVTDESRENSKFLKEFERFGLLPAFWDLCAGQFGFVDPEPTLDKLILTLFVTYTARSMGSGLPKPWQHFSSVKPGNIIVFMDNLMNHVLYSQQYDRLASEVAQQLRVAETLKSYELEWLLECDSFRQIDDLLLGWLVARLLQEDTGASLIGHSMLKICQLRRAKHFGQIYGLEYQLIGQAYQILLASYYTCPDHMDEIREQYVGQDFWLDQHYRKFYTAYDQLVDTHDYEKLRDLVENIYTNEYLGTLLPTWNKCFSTGEKSGLVEQKDFYKTFIRDTKDKLVVIISDALRYEVGQELFTRLNSDAKCKVKLDRMIGSLPSYTKLGMGSLLPHQEITMTPDYQVRLDGLPCDDLAQRETILRRYNEASRCVRYDDVKNMKRDDLRQLFTGMEVVYLYHDQIDARGDKLSTENEVFVACQEAVTELYDLIKRLSTSANSYHFLVTADHGFLYTRNKVQESDKINLASAKEAMVNRRFILSSSPVEAEGVFSLPLGELLGNGDDRVASFPMSGNVFKVSGGGQNYVHGGSSPQELIIPVLDVRTEKYHTETRPVQIALVSMLQKVTNLIVYLDFIQSESVSDVVKATRYRICFVTEDNEKISNECVLVADKSESSPQRRISRLRFDFKNQVYDKNRPYYLVAYEETNNLEIFRHSVLIDLAFADDFGFNV